MFWIPVWYFFCLNILYLRQIKFFKILALLGIFIVMPPRCPLRLALTLANIADQHWHCAKLLTSGANLGSHAKFQAIWANADILFLALAIHDLLAGTIKQRNPLQAAVALKHLR